VNLIPMLVLPPPEGRVTIRNSGELHITPLEKCPKCEGPLHYLCVNNGFTGKDDIGKLQQMVRIADCFACCIILFSLIQQCTPCDLAIFYTESYTLSDANMLLKRIEERNLATKYNRPTPHQDDFIPHPVSTQSSKNVTQCVKHGCARSRNKACTFFMCKACCLARPAHHKLCIEHRRRDDATPSRLRLSEPTPGQLHPPAPTPRSRLAVPPPIPPHLQPITNVSTGPALLQPRASPVPGQHAASSESRPNEIEDRVGVPRNNSHRRRGDRSLHSSSACTVYIWVEVRLNKQLQYTHARDANHDPGQSTRSPPPNVPPTSPRVHPARYP
jgi:hypothetical protein